MFTKNFRLKAVSLTTLALSVYTSSIFANDSVPPDTFFSPPRELNQVSLSRLDQLQLRLIELSPGVTKWMAPFELHELTKNSHKRGHCGGYVDITDSKKLGFSKPFRALEESLSQTGVLEPKHPNEVNKLIKEVRVENLTETVTTLSTKFKTRYYTTDESVKAAQWIIDKMKEYRGGRTDIEVETIAHSSSNPFKKWKMPSVRARILGNGPQKDEIVVIGGHIDSINQRGSNNNAPGADDDASGTATFLEAFRVLSQSGFKPNRTIEFVGYAAEEVGLLGSQVIANDYKSKNKKVVGVLQLDMTMFMGSGNVITFIADNVDAALTTFTTKLVDQYIKLPWKMSRCGYGCSDHVSWTKAGYPSVFPFESAFESYNEKIHSPDDLIGILNSEFGSEFSKLCVAFAVELGMN